jgi:hypothetical protein
MRLQCKCTALRCFDNCLCNNSSIAALHYIALFCSALLYSALFNFLLHLTPTGTNVKLINRHFTLQSRSKLQKRMDHADLTKAQFHATSRKFSTALRRGRTKKALASIRDTRGTTRNILSPSRYRSHYRGRIQ